MFKGFSSSYFALVFGLATALAAVPALAWDAGQPESPQQRVAVLKEWLQSSQAQLRNYQWLETTVVTHDGEQTSMEEKNCYYDVTGQLQKVPVEQSQAKKPMPGILPPGRLIDKLGEHKAKEMKEYMKNAADLVHMYIPPTVPLIQKAEDSGNMSLQILAPGREVQLDFRNYLIADDMLGVQINLQTNQLMGLVVDTFLGDDHDQISMDATTGLLPDGTIYPEKIVLSAPAKSVVITVTNSGYRKSGQ